MSRELIDLDPAFAATVKTLLQACADNGVHLTPFYTLRTPAEQARLWRQSRTTVQINKAQGWLRAKDAEDLADVLGSVGPQFGRWATNALPGFSWHQHGLAIDCFVQEEGRAVWSAKNKGYMIYAEEARDLGLHAGFFWSKVDAVHVQATEHKLDNYYSPREINNLMKEKFDGTG